MFKDLVDFLKKEGDFFFWRNIIFMAVVAGIANAGLLAVINSAAKIVENEGLNYRLFAIYGVVFLIFYITKRYSLTNSAQEVERIIKHVRDRISNKIVNSELMAMEHIDSSSIFTRLTRDTTVMSQSAFQITNASEAVIMILFALMYILILSPISFFVIIGGTAIVVAMFMSFTKIINSELSRVDSLEERFIYSLTAIVNGFKEIKINSLKRKDILQEHEEHLNSLGNAKVDTSTLTVTSMMYSEIFLYTLLGVVVFVVPHLTAQDGATILQVTATTLFIIGPIGMVVSVAPMVSRTNVAINNIYALERSFDEQSKMSVPVEQTGERIDDFENIQLKGTEFNYLDENDNSLFSIGPMDLNIKKGEIIFIVGGNGSGKSTLVKLLLGLYFPQKGQIFVDNQVIGRYNYQAYRDMFSIILGDFHLFERFYGLENVDKNLVNKLLVEMGLNHKTSFVDGRFTNINLSTGQKKRVALILSILENKQVYVFDEWAADQDPEFRKYFYHTILKKLRDEEKTIIAVTHDDAYFDVADKIYKMEYGQMVPYGRKG